MRRPAGAQARPAQPDRRGRPQGHRGEVARQAHQGRGEHRRPGRGRGPRARDRPDDALTRTGSRRPSRRSASTPGSSWPRRRKIRSRCTTARSSVEFGVDRRRRRRSTRPTPASAPWSMPRPRTSNCWPRARPSTGALSQASERKIVTVQPWVETARRQALPAHSRRARAIATWSAKCRRNRSRFRRPDASSVCPVRAGALRPGERAFSVGGKTRWSESWPMARTCRACVSAARPSMTPTSGSPPACAASPRASARWPTGTRTRSPWRSRRRATA